MSKHPTILAVRCLLRAGASALALGAVPAIAQTADGPAPVPAATSATPASASRTDIVPMVVPVPLVVAAPPAAPASAEPVTAAGPIDRGDGIAENRYFMTLLTQTFDGARERSLGQKAGFARLRRGDESWIRIDYGDGAMAIKRPARRQSERGQLAVAGFRNTTPDEIALAYNYTTHEMRGNSATAGYHNRYIRPLLDHAPPLGQDAAWDMTLTPAQLGFSDIRSGGMTIKLSRHYFTHAGRQYVLLEYTVPVFAYVDRTGETVMHWAKGAALADPGFGQIYWNGSLHHATAMADTGAPRPYRYARTYFATDGSAKPLVDVNAVPELRERLADFYAPSATAPIPAVDGIATPDQTPLQLAALIDIAAFSVAENSANQQGEVISSSQRGETGGNLSTWVVGAANTAAQAIDKAVGILTSPAVSNGVAPVVSAATTGASIAAQASASASVANLTQALAAEKAVAQAAERVSVLTQEANALKQEAAAAFKTLQRLTAERTVLSLGVANEFAANLKLPPGSPPATQALERFTQGAARIEAETEAATKTLTRVNALRQEAGATMAALLKQAPKLEAVVNTVGKATVLGTKLEQTLVRFPALAKGLTIFGYGVNAAGIYNTLSQSSQFDPSQVGGVHMVGNTESIGGVLGDVAAFVVGTGADALSGNMKAVGLDLINFSTAHLSDLGNAILANNYTNDQQKLYDQEEQLIRMRVMVQRLRQLNTRDDQLRQIESQIDFQLSTLKAPDPVVANQKPKPKPPTAKVPDRRPPVQVADQNRPKPQTPADPPPRQPGGVDYPQRDPSTVQVRPRPVQPAPDDPVPPPRPVPVADDAPIPTPVDLPLQHSIDDPVITDEGTAHLDVSPLVFDPVTFEPVTFTPVTFEPVTFEPVTWTPPTWVPPTFEAPKPSEIPWTDFGDDGTWPHQLNNLAYDYGDISGQVATDLSPYEAWLKGQNLQELERMALAAGYPNLAAALADARNLIRHATDQGFRQWAFDIPVSSGSIGIWASQAQHDLGRAQIALGDLLNGSRDIFSSGGFSDIGISGLNLAYLLRDYSLEDGDIIDIKLAQFGRTLYSGRLSLLNAGTQFTQPLRPGVAELTITAVNEGYSPPNTAEVLIDNVVRGNARQTYSLNTGDTATLRIESNAKGGR